MQKSLLLPGPSSTPPALHPCPASGCTAPEPEPTTTTTSGGGHGDPHIETLRGAHYTMAKPGSYTIWSRWSIWAISSAGRRYVVNDVCSSLCTLGITGNLLVLSAGECGMIVGPRSTRRTRTFHLVPFLTRTMFWPLQRLLHCSQEFCNL